MLHDEILEVDKRNIELVEPIHLTAEEDQACIGGDEARHMSGEIDDLNRRLGADFCALAVVEDDRLRGQERERSGGRAIRESVALQRIDLAHDVPILVEDKRDAHGALDVDCDVEATRFARALIGKRVVDRKGHLLGARSLAGERRRPTATPPS